MSNTTKVIYSTDSQFTNPQNVTESGQPASVTLDNLAANQDYYTKAELRAQDGTLLAESSVSTFKTLQAGTITPTYVSSVKNGNNWVVTYNYTSTYALSSAILTTNGSNFQGVIAGNTVTFTVTGLSDNQTYSTSITFTDIYTETQTTSGTIDTETGLHPFNIRNIAQSAATVDWNTDSDNRNLQYSEDKSTWTNVPYANGKYSVTIPVGKKYYFQGNSTNFGGWWGSDEDVEVGGYILSLNYQTMEQPSNQAVSYTRLFSKNNNDTLDGKLHFNFATLKIPVKNLASNGGLSMFGGCLSITTLNYDIFYTPDTIKLNDYSLSRLFQYCTNLTRVDGFNVRRFNNCDGRLELSFMFYNCTSLEYVADNFFDTTLTPSTSYFNDGSFGYMFTFCTSLTHPPVLPNVRGNYLFVYMFSWCTSLTDANKPSLPLLNNGNLGQNSNYSYDGCFQGIFYGCTGITQMDDLSVFNMGASGSRYFYEMYRESGITSIDASKMPTGTITQNCFYGMFRNTPITSIPSNLLPWTTLAEGCYREMFRDCSSLTSIPSGLLPATTLAEGCFYSMFENCVNMEGSVTLPAETLVTNCYGNTFKNCNSLEGIEVNFKSWTSGCTDDWVAGITNSTGTFTCFDELPQTTGNSNIPANWSINLKYGVGVPQITHDDTDVILINTTHLGNGTLYYTTDGSTPTSSSTQYTQPFLGVIGQTVKAVCIYQGTTSGVSTWVVAAEQLPEPTISGTPSAVTITNNDTSGASAVYYTTDGTTPSSSSTLYQQPFTVSGGDTVKAICVNTTGGQLLSDSNVASKTMRVYTELAYIHNQTMESSPAISKNIDTGIAMDNTIKFRYKCKFIGNYNGNVNVGAFSTDENDLRLFFAQYSVFVDWGSSREKKGYGFSGDIDLTCGNHYCYNNLTSSYLFQSSQANYTLGENCTVDCTSQWLKSLQIWKTINNVETLVFDGVAAEYNGAYGLWDKVSNTLKTNSTITIVGEIS